MPGTAEQILDTTERLIQTRGFNAISYQDVSDAVGIKKASIHHHFPTKNGLGAAVIERYRRSLMTLMEAVENEQKDPRRALELYFTPYREFADTPDKVCLCGALAGEYMALPPEMRDEVSRFFEEHQAWLERLLERGRRSGHFHFEGRARPLARLFFSALQGALLVKRSSGELSQMEDVIRSLKALVKGRS